MSRKLAYRLADARRAGEGYVALAKRAITTEGSVEVARLGETLLDYADMLEMFEAERKKKRNKRTK